MSEYGKSYYIGDTVFDRNDGIKYPPGVSIVQTITVRTNGGSQFIDNILRDNHCGIYVNKKCVVIGEVDSFADGDCGDKIVAWSYDARALTIQVVKGLR